MAATTTKLNITSNDKCPVDGAAKEGQAPETEDHPQSEFKTQSVGKPASGGEKEEDTNPPEQASTKDGGKPDLKLEPPDRGKASSDSTSWLNWFSKAENGKTANRSDPQPGADGGQGGNVVKSRPQSTMLQTPQEPSPSPIQRRNSEPNPMSPKAQEEPPSRSWLRLWGNATTQTTTTSSATATGVATNTSEEFNQTPSQSQKLDDGKVDPDSTLRPPPEPADAAKTYGWAFWSRDQSKGDDGKKGSLSSVGELAQAGSPSQSKPENAVVDEARGVPNKVGKRQRPHSLETPEESEKPRDADEDIKRATAPEAATAAAKTKPTGDPGSKAKRIPENLLLPAFKRTYQTAGKPGLIQQLSRLLQLGSQPDPRHVDIVPNPPRIKRALAIVRMPETTRFEGLCLFLMFRVFMAISLLH